MELNKKQKEIREGIHKALQGDKETVVGESCPYCEATNTALVYLHSVGCVLKVDRELPKKQSWIDYRAGQKDMLEAGYVAVESLV